MKIPFLLLTALVTSAITLYFEAEARPPLAATSGVAHGDIDKDGRRDRDDPIIDFAKGDTKDQGDYGIKVSLLGWEPAESTTCLDEDCVVTNANTNEFYKLVTVDGGKFALFHVPNGTTITLQPWNSGNLSCHEPALPGIEAECWTDVSSFAHDPLAVTTPTGLVIRLTNPTAIPPDS